jgi:Stress responsive A/B Barrel Domain
MITHMVLLRIREEGPNAQFGAYSRRSNRCKRGLAASSRTRGGGTRRQKAPDVDTQAFCMTFTDVEARDAYLPHPEHEKVKDSVLAIVEGGFEGVIAFDFAS